jgi:hypothetical protein
MIELTVIDRARLAAFIDGEGHIRIKGCSKGRYQISVSVTNTNPVLVRWCREVTGIGHIFASDRNRGSGHKVCFRWECASRQAAIVIEAIMPYLILKRAQAETTLAFQALVRNAGCRLDAANHDKRRALVSTIRTLNKCGTEAAA